MISESTFNKSKLILELKEIHSTLVVVYKELFNYKYLTNTNFKTFIDNEYKENGIGGKEKNKWNDGFCHKASYTLLNKILFIRICEDKGFMLNSEDFIGDEVKDPHIGEKLSKIGLQKWIKTITNYTIGGLIKFAFNDMKKSYNNIILYKEDKYDILNPTDEELSLKYLYKDIRLKQLVIDFESILSNIIEKLDTHAFNFKNTDSNILGDVYERFMDKEARKAIGQFYTPEFVIDYILSNTVANADVLDNPYVSVVDISCGSGHFLIMAYDILKEKFSNNLQKLREKYVNEIYYISHSGTYIKVSAAEYWTDKNIHYHILKNCIYGSDIDSFAIQLTTINLLLKDLDNFTDELNIIQCDSLIKWEKDYDWQDLSKQLNEEFEILRITQSDIFGEEEVYEVKQKKEKYVLRYKDILGVERNEDINRKSAEEIIDKCKFWNKGFAYVVGNPPYVGHKQLSMEYKQWLLMNYNNVFKDKSDLSFCFFDRIINILSEKGVSGIITSRYFMESPTGRNLRGHLQQNTNLIEIVDFYGAEIFKGVGVATAIYFFKKNNFKENKVNINKLSNDEHMFDDKTKLIDIIRTDLFENFLIDQNILEGDRWILIPEDDYKIYKKIISKTEHILDDLVISFQGIITGCDKAFVMTDRIAKEEGIEIGLLKKWIKNSNVKKYNITESDLVLIYADLISSEMDCPNSIEYIGRHRTKLENRRECLSGVRKWFGLQWGRENYLFEQPKIVFPYKSKTNKFALDINNNYCSADVYSMILKDKYNIEISLEYLTGILNSSIYEFYFKLFAKKMGKGIYDYYPNSVLDLKIITNVIVDSVKYNTEKIINLYLNIRNLTIFDLMECEDPVQCFVNTKIQNLKIKEEIYLLENKNDLIIGDYLGLEDEEYNLIYNSLNKTIIDELKEVFNKERFYKDYIIENKSIEQIASENNVDFELIEILWSNYIEEFLENEIIYKQIDLSQLFNIITDYLQESIVKILDIQNEPIDLFKLKTIISNEIPDINKLMNSLKVYNPKLSLEDLIRSTINNESFTWSMYIKARYEDKVNRAFVKYYNTDFYGLCIWSDEIHKKYFMDEVEEYTSNNPNEKKAKDIIKFFNELIIENKEDYIDIIESKIKRKFN